MVLLCLCPSTPNHDPLVFSPELHLYEGFICRRDVQTFLRTGLRMVGLRRSKAEEVSDAWQTAAAVLLDRIFQKWTPSEPRSTESLCQNLMDFTRSFSSAPDRTSYPDGSRPLVVKVGSVRRAEGGFGFPAALRR